LYWGEEKCIQVVDGEATRKGQLGRPKCRWKYNIKINLRGM
jgi:hypothetical protein